MDTKETRPAARLRRHPAARPTARSGAVATKRPVAKKAPTRPAPRKRAPQPVRPPRPEPEIVYTPAKPVNKGRLLLQLGVVAAVVLAVFFSLSLFFKVVEDEIKVSGNDRYSARAIVEASGLRAGDSLLAVNKPQVSGKIITELPYIKSVRIGIKLPGTVNIEVEELDVVYAVPEAGGSWWLINAEGRLVEKTDAAAASEHTQVLGVELELPVAGQQATARESVPEGTMAEGETQPVTISNAQRLQTALTILQYLEDHDVLGDVVSVDVTDMGSIKMQYGQRFQIQLGDTSQLSYKIDMALAAVEQLADHDRGTLDVSFIVRQEVVYTPRAD